MILGALGQYSPFIHHGSLGKYLASGASKHPKQGVSVYAENYANRIDTSAHLLHHNERPIIHGRMNRAIHNDEIGTGQTIIVAVSYYDGHNQEDGLLANESSLDFGLLNSSYYKMYEEMEKIGVESPAYWNAIKELQFYNNRQNEKDFADSMYWRSPGEAEARMVTDRYMQRLALIDDLPMPWEQKETIKKKLDMT